MRRKTLNFKPQKRCREITVRYFQRLSNSLIFNNVVKNSQPLHPKKHNIKETYIFSKETTNKICYPKQLLKLKYSINVGISFKQSRTANKIRQSLKTFYIHTKQNRRVFSQLSITQLISISIEMFCPLGMSQVCVLVASGPSY